MALKIKNIFAYEVLDSRGFPTVAAIAQVSGGLLKKRSAFAKAIVPSGASTGEREALELRDQDPDRYHGKGVKTAVKNINDEIAPALISSKINPDEQEEIDKFLVALDGTKNKSKFGANALLAVSLAVAKAVAKYYNHPFYRYVAELYRGSESFFETKFHLPLPMVNVINGGEHADNTIDFQEFMFMPVGARSMHEAVRMASECFHTLQKILHEKGYNTNKGDEGGFAPNLKSAEEALTLMTQAVISAGFHPGVDQGNVAFALDCAASELYDSQKKVYVFKKALAAGLMTEKQATKTTDQMIAYLKSLVDKFPIVSIEDGLDQSDLEGFSKLVQVLGQRVQIVGDDLFCTNPEITAQGVQRQLANSVLVKLNQIGTLSETLKTIKIADKAGWTFVISHRSGETEDTTIADLAVGTGSNQIKTGSMSRSERIAKYNRLLEIEMEVGRSQAVFLGLQSFKNLTLPLGKESEPILIGQEEEQEQVDVSSLSLVDKPTRSKGKKKVKKGLKTTTTVAAAEEVEELSLFESDEQKEDTEMPFVFEQEEAMTTEQEQETTSLPEDLEVGKQEEQLAVEVKKEVAPKKKASGKKTTKTTGKKTAGGKKVTTRKTTQKKGKSAVKVAKTS